MMEMSRSVHARLIERFIFNFRLRPEALASQISVPFLRPQVFNGWSVVSFCLMKIERVMFSPLPSLPGFQTISCAYRCGVLDTSGAQPEPSVYIPGRYSDLPLITRLAPWVFSAAMPGIDAALEQEGAGRTVRVRTLDGRCLFAAEVQPSSSISERSELFDSMDSFARFMHCGVSSYTPAISGDALARVDLQKSDGSYEPLHATIDYNVLDSIWPDAGLIFDSAVRATGSLYKWTYKGLVERSENTICR